MFLRKVLYRINSAGKMCLMDGKVRLKFWVLRSGEVVEIEIERTSGVPEFDQDASQVYVKLIKLGEKGLQPDSLSREEINNCL